MFVSKGAIGLLKGYQYFLSPLLGVNCRFYPSCSHYCKTAIEQFGLVKGAYLSIGRLLRCHPWCEGGYDPVLKKKHGKNG